MATDGNDTTEPLGCKDLLYLAGHTMDLAAERMFCMDSAGRFLYANKTACSCLGYTWDEIRSLRVSDVFPEFAVNFLSTSDFASRQVAKDGQTSPVKVTAERIALDGGEYICAIVREIPEPRAQEQELIQARKQLEAIFETSQAGILLVSPRGVITFANHRMAEMFGYTLEELIGTTYPDHVHPDQRGDGDTRMRMLITGEIEHVHTERHFIRKDGSDFWGHISGRRHDDAEGNLISLVGVIADITDIKSAHRAIQESEKRYRNIIENMQDVYYRSDAEGRLTMLSPSGAKLLGYESAELILGKMIRDNFYYDATERDAFLHNLKMKGHLYGYELTLRRKDGTLVPVATSSHLLYDDDGSFLGVEGVFRDMSEYQKTISLLAASEEMFSRAFNHSPVLMTISDLADGRYLEVNEKFCQVSGFSRQEAIGRTSVELGWISRADREPLVEVLRRGARVSDMEIDLTAKDGRRVSCLYSAELVTIEGQQRLLSIALDITERKLAETALRQSEKTLMSLIESNPESQFLVERDGTIVMANRALAHRLGKRIEEVQGHNVSQFEFPDIHERRLLLLEQVFMTGKPFSFEEARGSLELENHMYPVFDQDGEVSRVAILSIDVTEKNQMHRELVKSQKLESLGLLAGGIAHDFNNILTGILGNISFARMLLEPDSRVALRLEESEKAALRAAELTKQLLTFARGGEPVKRAVNTERLINESLALSIRGTNVKGVVTCPADIWPMHADAGQMSQVLNNLLINARQAMETGGTVHVNAGNCVIPAGDLLLHEPGAYVRIEVADEGHGIAEEDVARIFDPYFSTKEGGTGLGLASVYSIVTRHGGAVQVASVSGKGTKFIVHIPACDESLPEQDAAPSGDRRVPGMGRILVMDDEAIIRELVTEMLGESGYEVVTCADGREAVECFSLGRASGTPFDAAILDLTVPGGMGGVEVAAMIRKVDREIVLLVSSGYSTNPVVAGYREHGFDGCVSKPYTYEQLTVELAGLLASRRQGT